MKKTFLKKALTLISGAVMAGAIGLGAGLGSAVHADTADPKGTTDVVVTKLAVPGEPDVKGIPTNTVLTDQKTVEGAGFVVYDITQQYWDAVDADIIKTDSNDPDVGSTKVAEMANPEVEAPDKKDDATDKEADATDKEADAKDKFDVSGDPIRTEKTTGPAGTVTFNLPNYGTWTKKDSDGKVVQVVSKPAIYLFHESTTPAGFKASVNFVVGLPTETANDHKAYVYPKDEIDGHYQLKFTKVDANNQETVLQGAEFYIKNAAGKYAKVDGYSDGFDGTEKDVSWVDGPDGATAFISGSNGEFGFTAAIKYTVNGTEYGLDPNGKYTIEETTAPKGYQKDANILDVNQKDSLKEVTPAEVTTEDTKGYTVTDTPQGILPHTGGKGIIAIVVCGVAMTIIGLVAYNKRRANA
ncbi:pilin N-terminal domain-containing protein [Lacticaseibacillus hulanensis]|uniref:pilin N-terminal domain-containing protein n=1 Tax=Lacticaseibacillus hulanensis TaxID=2493111 RepID=UPI000FD810E3|nr:pilin N-terminal domain-containing protein [Lacticaseibacillus hulanensis]